MAEQPRPRLYIYTRKSIMVNNIQQNFDLIPKLFSNNEIYSLKDNPSNPSGIAILTAEIQNIKNTFRLKYPTIELNKINIYTYLLNEYTSTNLIKVNFTYFPREFHSCIIEVLQKLVDSQSLYNSPNDENQIDLFIIHLLNGHEMEYGLYFSFKYAYDDNDFLKFTQNVLEPNMSIVYFARFDELLDYITPIKLDFMKKFSEQYIDYDVPILYANNGWDYGLMNEETIHFDCANKITFFNNINNYLNLQEGELICQLPLPMNIFRTIFVSKGKTLKFWPDNKMQRKYLKYKQKYLKLKNRQN